MKLNETLERLTLYEISEAEEHDHDVERKEKFQQFKSKYD
jgi:hypothetical protein